ncbi:nucleolar transcription factor 1-like [Sycon ciliatum]|uniref:nucleolar transcription factor 1-like n=1 Tax=Sycon ciliatum TaxID=27933 RepID=UPI0031F5FECE
MSSDKSKKSRKRRRDTEAEDEEDGAAAAVMDIPPTPASERKKKKKRRHSEVGGDEDDAAVEEAITPRRKKRKSQRKEEWSSELDMELLTTSLPLISKNALAKRSKSSKTTDLDFTTSDIGAFSTEECNERLRQLEAIVKPVKTRHQILSEALDMVKGRSATYVNKMFSEACPKRPASAYMLFCKDHRDGIQVEGKPSAAMQLLAQKWRELGDREKSKYLKKSAAEGVKYDSEMSKFKEAHPDLFIPKKVPGAKGKKAQVGPNPPPRSALAAFKVDYGAKHSGDTKDASGQAWKDLATNAKAQWVEKWRAMVVQYRAELTRLRSSASTEDQEQIDSLLEKHTIRKTVNQVGYDLFAKTKRAELRAFHPKDSMKDINGKLKVQWSALPDIDRQRYCQQAKLLQDD